MAAAPGMGGFQPRIDAFGQPTQSVQFGTCKFPGCQFPKRIEGNKMHDFCSRTCAKKFSQLPPQMQGTGSSNCHQSIFNITDIQLVAQLHLRVDK